MNVFELLKHENHDLEVVRLYNNVLLGCVTCGEIIANLYDVSDYEVLTNYKNILKEKECENLLNTFDVFEREMCEFIHKLVKNHIEKFINEYISSSFDYVYDMDTGVNFSIYDYLFDKSTLHNVILKKYGEVDFLAYLYESNFPNVREELVEIAYNKAKEDNDNMILLPGQNYVVSNKIIEWETSRLSSKYSDFVVLSKGLVEEAEKNNPTVTDVLTFNSEESFCTYIRDSSNKKIFKYRVAKGLIDISNLNKKAIVKILDDVEPDSNEYLTLAMLFEK